MFIIPLTTSLLSYAVSHDFSKSHCQKADWLNGIHLRWTSIAICRLRCLIPWQIRSTCLRCSCPWVLLDRERITYQAILFICNRFTRFYSGVLTYALPIMLLCAVRLRFSNRHGYRFSYLTGSSPVWNLYYFSSPCYQIAPVGLLLSDSLFFVFGIFSLTFLKKWI